MVAAAIMGLVFTITLSFTSVTMHTLVGISNQSYLNRKAGFGIEYITSRIRQANTITNNAAGTKIAMAFDDDIDVDSDGDDITYNDLDHWEYAEFKDEDGNLATTSDNQIVYTSIVGAEEFIFTVIKKGVRKLPDLEIFSITSNVIVNINFGLISESTSGRTQTIEVSTKVVARNLLE